MLGRHFTAFQGVTILRSKMSAVTENCNHFAFPHESRNFIGNSSTIPFRYDTPATRTPPQLVKYLPILVRNIHQRIHDPEIYISHAPPSRAPILSPKSIAVNICTLKSSLTFPRISTAFVGCKCASWCEVRGLGRGTRLTWTRIWPFDSIRQVSPWSWTGFPMIRTVWPGLEDLSVGGTDELFP
jgi:hypothetical protein